MWIFVFPQVVYKFVEKQDPDFKEIAICTARKAKIACGYVVGKSWKDTGK